MKKIDLLQLEQICSDILSILQSYDQVLFSIFDTMFKTGLRYNDICRMYAEKQGANWIFICPTSKGGAVKYYQATDLNNQFAISLQNGLNLTALTSYSNAKRIFKRVNPHGPLYVRSKPVTTHIFRHLKAKQLKASGQSDIAIQNVLGQKKLSSTQVYIYSIIYSF